MNTTAPPPAVTDLDEDDYPELPAGYFERFVMDEDEQVPDRPYTFVCSTCLRDVDVDPCPEHAPLTPPPGLRLVECGASPRHWAFVVDREDYGVPCPWCRLAEYYEQERLARQCRHWAWRRSRIIRQVYNRILRPLTLAVGSSWKHGDGCVGCMTFYWRWHLLPAAWRRRSW